MRTKFFNLFTLSLILFISSTSLLFAVNDNPKRSEKIRESFWNSGDKNFDATEIPAKWKDESAVIIAKSSLLSYKKDVWLNTLNYDNYSHYRIKLLDKKAIEEYSQFSIPDNKIEYLNTTHVYAGFKVIKPSGEEIIIPVSNAVLEKGNLDHEKFKTLKLAIPNLEVGDIIDYYIAEELNFTPWSRYYIFDPVIFKLNSRHPIMKQKISFNVMRRCFINLKTLNGAPKFKEVNDEADDKTYYTLEDENRESIEDLRWFYPYRQIPSIKFKVLYAEKSEARSFPGFKGEYEKPKYEVSKDEVLELIEYLYDETEISSSLWSYMKRNKLNKEKNLDKLARDAYNAFRHTSYKGSQVYLITDDNDYFESKSSRVLLNLSKYYSRMKIPHEILIGIPRHISDLKDLILENELIYMLKVNTKNPFYISELGINQSYGSINPSLQGATVYSWQQAPAGKELKKITIPIDLAEANNTTSTVNIELKDMNEDLVEFELKRSAKGESKIYYQDLLMDYYTYNQEEQKRYNYTDAFNGKKDEIARLEQLKKKYLEGRTEKFNEALKNSMASDYDMSIEKVDDINIMKTGRYEENPEFVYTCKVEAKGTIKKVGPNYLIDIGKFLDMQVKLTDEERTRKYDIHMPYARSFEYTIKLHIPQGYTVEGVEDLNTEAINDTGGFSASAKLEGDQLIIHSKKYYNHNFEKVEKWPDMVKFLDESYNFTQKKVLLKKQ
ncbi:DUF3857 domain-containing protein [Fulvivirga sediminis]|uniref:DUF3857 domain-containing protein n=1 Tax=Fulvivirga sediminis TaxID=2803949 RepID=A0A937FEM2_9BACT|nr:DUF3857 domain-containing protein [Fulvivirga sediminis]MBL3658983.1 DUF3857 domain-containing protein [Fulvivirga sediminis]